VAGQLDVSRGTAPAGTRGTHRIARVAREFVFAGARVRAEDFVVGCEDMVKLSGPKGRVERCGWVKSCCPARRPNSIGGKPVKDEATRPSEQNHIGGNNNAPSPCRLGLCLSSDIHSEYPPARSPYSQTRLDCD